MTHRLLGSLALILAVSACGRTPPTAISDVPAPTRIITDDKLVPVECSATATLDTVDSDGLKVEQTTEEKLYRLTRSDAQHRRNTATLEGAAIRCGVKVNRK